MGNRENYPEVYGLLIVHVDVPSAEGGNLNTAFGNSHRFAEWSVATRQLLVKFLRTIRKNRPLDAKENVTPGLQRNFNYSVGFDFTQYGFVDIEGTERNHTGQQNFPGCGHKLPSVFYTDAQRIENE